MRLTARREQASAALTRLESQRAEVERRISALKALLEAHVDRPVVFDRSSPTDEALGWIAHVYRWAVALGEPPKQAISADLDVSPATAGRWIAAARAAGRLHPSDVDPRGRVAEKRGR